MSLAESCIMWVAIDHWSIVLLHDIKIDFDHHSLDHCLDVWVSSPHLLAASISLQAQLRSPRGFPGHDWFVGVAFLSGRWLDLSCGMG